LAMAIDIARHDPAWPAQFHAEACRLTELLEPWLATPVEHIGSTSVAGLAAKPVLDMMAGVSDLDAGRDAIPVLTSHIGWPRRSTGSACCLSGAVTSPLPCRTADIAPPQVPRSWPSACELQVVHRLDRRRRENRAEPTLASR
jgi:GrpB-like predicted nucleotidyltransferase (UPF0157 family)